MNKITHSLISAAHSILKAILLALAYLPLPVLYGISDILFVITFHIVRYRRKVVMENLRGAFPDKTSLQLHMISRRFYRNLTDLFVETIKLAHISDDEMRRRMVYENAEIVDELFGKGKSITCYFAHIINWEWATSITLWTRHHPGKNIIYSQVYRPLDNHWFDHYFLHLRSRFHSICYPKATVLRDILGWRRDNALGICGFMSDQKPSHGDPTHVMRFLNRPTAMITGTETLSRRLGMAVVYMDLHKIKRGHYKMVMRKITDDASTLPPMQLTERYATLLQTTIERDPSLWLWTHKRWKIPVTLPDENPPSPQSNATEHKP